MLTGSLRFCHACFRGLKKFGDSSCFDCIEIQRPISKGFCKLKLLAVEKFSTWSI